ncbi:MAG: hypothetical protein ABUT39_03660 [Acidobacteriota bacterium]
MDADIAEPAKAQENLLLLVGVDTATVKFGESSLEVAVQHDLGARNSFHYQWSVGPATPGDEDGETTEGGGTSAVSAETDQDTNDQSPGALRLRYTEDYARGGFFGAMLDRFQLSFSATLTHNDLDNQSENIPRTQRLYKATISYLENLDSGFKVLTSIEDGSAGVMLRKVRQYFVGVAISKLDLNGSGGN